MSVRAGHEWYVGVPGSYTDKHLKQLAGRWVACPGCTVDAFTEGNCHTGPIIEEFKTKFPVLEPPRFVSVCTKVVEGKGGLRDVLITRDAVFMGCLPPRAAPTARELGVSLPASIFGNPEVQKRLDEGKEKARETKAAKKREAKHGQGTVPGGLTEIRDLPVRTMAESEAERRACFDKAYAQQRKRVAAGGPAVLPYGEKKQKVAFEKPAKPAKPVKPAKAAAKAPVPAAPAAPAAPLSERWQVRDSDSDSGSDSD